MTGHGLIFDEIKPEDWVLGAEKSIGGAVLRPDRDWRPFVPTHQETQNRGFETFACTNFGTANAIEILLNALFKDTKDFSDRWYAKASGTTIANQGNSPHWVAEYARKTGLVLEPKWPFDETVTTPEKFYSEFPQDLYYDADKLIKDYTLNHEWVPNNADSIYDALQYSPLGFSAYAWKKDSNGFYFRPSGANDNHWTVLVYAEKGKYWLVLDSYKDGDVLFKKIRWDSLPMMCKRYSVTKTPYLFLKNLYYGITHPDVPELQKALMSLGYKIPSGPTDFFGDETKSALSWFQLSQGIDDDGTHFGWRTRAALNRKLQPSSGLSGLVTLIRTYLGF